MSNLINEKVVQLSEFKRKREEMTDRAIEDAVKRSDEELYYRRLKVEVPEGLVSHFQNTHQKNPDQPPEITVKEAAALLEVIYRKRVDEEPDLVIKSEILNQYFRDMADILLLDPSKIPPELR